VLRDVFNFQPKLPKELFLKSGYAERKVILTLNILLLCQAKHKELTNSASHGKLRSRKYKVAGGSTGHSYLKRTAQGEEGLEQPLVHCVQEPETCVATVHEKGLESSYERNYHHCHHGCHAAGKSCEEEQGPKKHLDFNYSSKIIHISQASQ